MRFVWVLYLLLAVQSISIPVDHRHEDILIKNAELLTNADSDPLLLIEVDKKVNNIHQTLQIVEKSDEEVNGYRSPSSRSDYYFAIALSPIQGLELKKYRDSRKAKLSPSSSTNSESGKDNADNKVVKRPRFRRRKMEPSQPMTISLPQYNYEERWPWVEEYHRNHSKISPSCLEKRHALLREITQMYPTQESDHKYVVYSPTKAGLGNTLAAMSEALLLAIYSKRNFAIYRWNTILEFFTFPYHRPIIHKTLYSRASASTILSQYGKHCNLDFDAILSGEDSHQFIVMETGACGLLNYFVHSPSLSQWMEDHGIVPPNTQNHLSRMHYLLQFLYVDVMIPNPSIWSQVQQFKQQVQWDSMQVIGIHIRTGMLDGNVPWGRFLEKEDIDLFAMEAERYTKKLERRDRKKPVKWLVMVDHKEVREDFKKIAGEHYLSSERSVIHSKDGELKGIENSLIDSYLLSDCDVLILTMKSTYGYLAKHRCEAVHNSIAPGAYKKLKKSPSS